MSDSPDDDGRKLHGQRDIGKRKVQENYRVKVPMKTLGLEPGDEVDATFSLDGGEEVVVRGVPVRPSGRVLIPYYKRHGTGLEVGDRVGVRLSVHG